MSGLIWLKAIVLSTGATSLVACCLGLLHSRLDETSSEPTSRITVDACVVDDARQTAIAMIGSNNWQSSARRRTCLIGLELSSQPSGVALSSRFLEPVSIAAGPNGQLLVAAVDGGVYLINPKRPYDQPVVISRHKQPPFQIMCSPDGRWLLTVEFQRLCAWDLSSGELRWRRRGIDVCTFALVPTTNVIVCGMADGSVAELSLETGYDLRRMNRHQDPVTKVTVSYQGDRVASYCTGQDLCVTDRLTGKSIWQHRAVYSAPCIKFSQDGRQLITAGNIEGQWTVQVWNLENLKCSSELKGHAGPVNGAEFLSGEELLTWSGDGTLRRWSIATGLLEVISPAWSDSSDKRIRTMFEGPPYAN